MIKNLSNHTNILNLYNFQNQFLLLCNLAKSSKLPNSIIIDGKKGIGKKIFSKHLINYILSQDEEHRYNIDNFEINYNNKSHKLLLSNSHPNVHIIDLNDGRNSISIEQIRNMIYYSNKSSFNNKYKIILINNSEYLNKNSSNALLKVVEEPNKNTIFIILQNSENKNLKTIQSRCIKFNLKLNFEKVINTVNKILNLEIFDNINSELISYYSTPGDILNLLNFASEENLELKNISLENFVREIITKKLYLKNFFIKNNFESYFEKYILNLTKNNINKNKFFNYHDQLIQKKSKANIYNLDRESIYIDYSRNIFNE